jgi:alpha-glucosidase (family GH31 glycosyl hydrolase)
LVAPVTEEGVSSWPVYLPEGEWSDFWTGEVFAGSQIIRVSSPIERIPIFQKKGSIIPLNLGKTLELCSSVGNSTDELTNLTLLINPWEETRSTFYQGVKHQFGQISAQCASGNLSITINLKGLVQAVDLLVLGNEPHQVSVDGISLPSLEVSAERKTIFWRWIPDRHATRIHIPQNQETATVILS